MAYAIVGLTGNTGAVVADTLLKQGKRVRGVVRDANKAADWKERGVELELADVTDAKQLTEAFAGVEGAYVLLPPDPPAADYFASRQRVIDALIAAVEEAQVPRVVLLSSVGAHQEQGTGPIRVLRPIEEAWREREGVTFLRAAYFQQNLAMALGPAAEHGVFHAFFDPEKPIEMVSTLDIGQTAAELLQGEPGEAPRVVNLAGPRRYRLHDAVEVMERLFERRIAVERLPGQAIVPILKGMGIGQLAELYGELNEAVDDDRLEFEMPPEVRRGGHTLEQALTQLVAASHGG